MIFYSQLGTGTNFTNFGHHFRLTRIFELVKLVPVPSCVYQLRIPPKICLAYTAFFFSPNFRIFRFSEKYGNIW